MSSSDFDWCPTDYSSSTDDNENEEEKKPEYKIDIQNNKIELDLSCKVRICHCPKFEEIIFDYVNNSTLLSKCKHCFHLKKFHEQPSFEYIFNVIQNYNNINYPGIFKKYHLQRNKICYKILEFIEHMVTNKFFQFKNPPLCFKIHEPIELRASYKMVINFEQIKLNIDLINDDFHLFLKEIFKNLDKLDMSHFLMVIYLIFTVLKIDNKMPMRDWFDYNKQLLKEIKKLIVPAMETNALQTKICRINHKQYGNYFQCDVTFEPSYDRNNNHPWPGETHHCTFWNCPSVKQFKCCNNNILCSKHEPPQGSNNFQIQGCQEYVDFLNHIEKVSHHKYYWYYCRDHHDISKHWHTKYKNYQFDKYQFSQMFYSPKNKVILTITRLLEYIVTNKIIYSQNNIEGNHWHYHCGLDFYNFSEMIQFLEILFGAITIDNFDAIKFNNHSSKVNKIFCAAFIEDVLKELYNQNAEFWQFIYDLIYHGILYGNTLKNNGDLFALTSSHFGLHSQYYCNHNQHFENNGNLYKYILPQKTKKKEKIFIKYDIDHNGNWPPQNIKEIDPNISFEIDRFLYDENVNDNDNSDKHSFKYIWHFSLVDHKKHASYFIDEALNQYYKLNDHLEIVIFKIWTFLSNDFKYNQILYSDLMRYYQQFDSNKDWSSRCQFLLLHYGHYLDNYQQALSMEQFRTMFVELLLDHPLQFIMDFCQPCFDIGKQRKQFMEQYQHYDKFCAGNYDEQDGDFYCGTCWIDHFEKYYYKISGREHNYNFEKTIMQIILDKLLCDRNDLLQENILEIFKLFQSLIENQYVENPILWPQIKIDDDDDEFE